MPVWETNAPPMRCKRCFGATRSGQPLPGSLIGRAPDSGSGGWRFESSPGSTPEGLWSSGFFICTPLAVISAHPVSGALLQGWLTPTALPGSSPCEVEQHWI